MSLMVASFLSFFCNTIASPYRQRYDQFLQLIQVWGKAWAGLRVSDEQGPPPVGHHHQSTGRRPQTLLSLVIKLSIPVCLIFDSAWLSECCSVTVVCILLSVTLWFQAIMMSICLQSMVDELMVKKSGGSIKKVCVSYNGLHSLFILTHSVFYSYWGDRVLFWSYNTSKC